VLVRGTPVASSRILHGNSATNNDHALHYDALSTGFQSVAMTAGLTGVPGFASRPILLDNGLDPDPTQNTWEIRELAWFGLAQLLVVAQERSL
jgi:hypothetical protein